MVGQRLLSLLLLLLPLASFAQRPQLDHDYLLIGEPTAEQTPIRACPPGVLERLGDGILIPAPVGGWSGAPQAVDVFNVFAGEVMISHGDRQICGNMQDARTRDSR